jgi:hypothetical protein
LKRVKAKLAYCHFASTSSRNSGLNFRVATGFFGRNRKNTRSWLFLKMAGFLSPAVLPNFKQYFRRYFVNNSNSKKCDKPKKIKKTYAFSPQIAELIETHKYVNNRSELAFVSQAIKEYAADIDGEKNLDVFTYRFMNQVRACTRNDMNRLSAMVFKIAVELAKANYILGANIIDMTDEELEDLNERAKHAVRCNYGFFSIEQAVKDERKLNGYDENDN